MSTSHISVGARCAEYPVSDHFDGKRFFNPTLPNAALPGLRDVIKMSREPRAAWPASVAVSATPRLHEKLGDGEVAVTFVNHATFLIQSKHHTVLTDPVWSKRASPVRWAGPARVVEPGVDFDALPRIDLILISHNHYDHLDTRTLRKLNARFAPKIVVPLGNRSLVESLGFTDVRELDWWQTLEAAPDLKITFTPAQHFSARSLFDRQKTLWGGYMMQLGNRRVFFGGDSGYSIHYSNIRRMLGAPDLALLGIGAYEPRWFMAPMHMNPAEAVQAHQDLGARQSIGMHFGTFRLSGEGIDQPVIDLEAALGAAGIPANHFTTLKEGETRVYNLGPSSPTSGE